MFETVKIERFDLRKNETKSLDDKVVTEVPLTIRLNNQELGTLLCSPDKLKELVVGYLLVEGFIEQTADLEDILIDNKAFTAKVKAKKEISLKQVQKNRVVTSGCGRNISFYNFEDFKNCPSVESDLCVTGKVILALMLEFQKKSQVFQETGGVHSAALCQKDQIVSFAEDIGRHNAVDKIVGELLLKGATTEDKFILLSGRISSEMLLKTARIGIPIIVSRSAPTDMAVRLAKQLKITLVGFARGMRMNIYSEKGRVLCQK